MNPRIHVVGEALPEAWLSGPDLTAALEALTPKPALPAPAERKRLVDGAMAILQRARKGLGPQSTLSETRRRLLLPILVHFLGVGRHEIRRDFRIPDPDGGEPFVADLVAVRDDRVTQEPMTPAGALPRKRTRRSGGVDDEVADENLVQDLRSEDEVASEARARPYLVAFLRAYDDDLDARRSGLRGGRMIQQAAERLLHLGGASVAIVANGRELRVVRSGASGDSRYVAFDLDRLGLEGDDTREALEVLLLLTGRDRLLVVGDREADLTRLLAAGDTYGTDIGRKLGQQARSALEALLTAALKRSPSLAERARTDREFVKALFHEGLFTLYRLFFVLYSEARGLLELGNTAYRDGYALDPWVKALVNQNAVDAQPNAPDGSRRYQVRALFDLLREGSDHPELHITTYGGKLFAPAQTAHIFGVEGNIELPGVPFSDQDLAGVLFLLTHAEVRAGRAKPRTVRVSYRDLGVEQLGGVYEGLLEYTPEVAREHMVFAKLARDEKPLDDAIVPKTSPLVSTVLREIPVGSFFLQVRGGARKGSGSYYTPKVLTDFLVKAGLKAKIEEIHSEVHRLAEKRREAIRVARAEVAAGARDGQLFGPPAELPPGTPTTDELEACRDRLLTIRVCDPAMGSGAFLVTAVKHLADGYEAAFRLSEGCGTKLFDHESWPDDPHMRERIRARIRRRIANHCVYGVDKNELAVELAKVSLWLVTLSRDRPLTFLNHRLRHGDSLMGAPLLRRDEYSVKRGKDEPRVLQGPAISFIRSEAYDADGAETSDAHRRVAIEAREENQEILFNQAGQEAQLSLFEARRLNIAPLLAEYIATRDHVSGDEPENWPTLRVVEELGRREEELRAALDKPAWLALRAICDLWCASFLWPDEGAANPPPTTIEYQVAVRWRLSGESPPPSVTLQRIHQLFQAAAVVRSEHPFFHWELEFPELFFLHAEGSAAMPRSEVDRGFDLVMGNPPWDKVHARVVEFWRPIDPEVSVIKADEIREWARPIRLARPELDKGFVSWLRGYEGRNRFLRGAGTYHRQGGGNPNTYKYFLERFDGLSRESGVCSLLIPGAIYSDAEAVEMRRFLMSERRIVQLIGVDNGAKPPLFPDVHTSFKFAILTFAKQRPRAPGVPCAFFVGRDEIGDVRALDETGLARIAREVLGNAAAVMTWLPYEALRVLSPHMEALVELPTANDFWLAIHLATVAPRFGDTTKDPWRVQASRELHGSANRRIFRSADWLRDNGFQAEDAVGWLRKSDGARAAPLFGAGAFDQYDAFAGSILAWVVETEGQAALGGTRASTSREPSPRAVAWAHPRAVFRRRSRGTDARTLIAAVIPRSFSEFTATAMVLPLELDAVFQSVAYLNSFCFDVQLRPRVSMDVTLAHLVALGFPRASKSDPVAVRCVRRAASLTFSDSRKDSVFAPIWEELRVRNRTFSLDATPPREMSYSPWTRGLWRAEIDALVAHRMRLSAEAFAHVLATFPLLDSREPKLEGEKQSTITRDLALLALFQLHGRTPPTDLREFYASAGLPRLAPSREVDLVTRIKGAYERGASAYLSDLLSKKRDATAPIKPREGPMPPLWSRFAWSPDFQVMPPDETFHRPGRTVPLEALRGVALAGANLVVDAETLDDEAVEQGTETE